jgi:hypothetical protein
MSGKNILVVAVDGLRAAALGAYGNTWYETPQLDQFAAESFLAEWCFAASPDLADIYRELWFGCHPLRPADHGTSSLSLVRQCAERGVRTRLITDDPALAEFPGGGDFDDVVALPKAAPAIAPDLGATHLATLFANLDLTAAGDPSSQLVWLHLGGMYGGWDAPLEMRHALADEDDPTPYVDAASPDLEIDPTADPDVRFRYACAYAAQVQVLDACVGALLTELQGSSWTTILTGVRGFPLGEHGRVGGLNVQLHAEQLHVPLLVRSPNGAGQLHRASELVEHADIGATVVEFCQQNTAPQMFGDGLSLLPLIHAGAATWRDHLVACSSTGTRAVRTSHWCWQQLEPQAGAEGGDAVAKLFVRPDDRWEANDIASLCPDEVAALSQTATEFEARCQAGESLSSLSLPASLHNER